jgi:hypothetical protein
MSAESERIRRQLGFGLIGAKRAQSARHPAQAMHHHPKPMALPGKAEIDRTLREGVCLG